jgi:hypothetical protein
MAQMTWTYKTDGVLIWQSMLICRGLRGDIYSRHSLIGPTDF